MIELEYLQTYWWHLISVLGAALVFLLFVQGGQTMLLAHSNTIERTMLVNSLGRKWELTFTTLVVFGGAFFASFPLFYSTSFGGAYWLWMLILFSFIVQAVSYEYRRKPGNVYGTKTYDVLLFINGCVGCILLGVAVAMFFFGAQFTVEMKQLTDIGSPVISRWAPTRGLEAIFCWKNLLLGVAVLFLARTQAALYFLHNLADDPHMFALNKRRVLFNGLIFAVLFVAFVVVLFVSPGLQNISKDGIPALNDSFVSVPHKYLNNMLEMWWVGIIFLLGVVLVLFAIGKAAFSAHFVHGIWFSGLGTALVVMSLFWIAGFNGTPYYPSLLDPDSSLSIYNSSSSRFTLEVMSWVSILLPFVIGYIAYVWYSMDRQPITPAEMRSDEHKY